MPWTSPIDVAEVAVEELTELRPINTIRYIVSEELTGPEVAKIIGEAIQMPELKWEEISNEELIKKFRAAGMKADIAQSIGEMNAALGSGLMMEDYVKNKHRQMGRVKLKEFAKEFAKMI